MDENNENQNSNITKDEIKKEASETLSEVKNQSKTLI